MGMIGNTPYQGQVGSGNIQDGSIDTIDIKDLAVTSAKLNFNDQIANSVPYLNGSKVLTTGSALTFDGTNLGIGTSSPGAKLGVSGNQINFGTNPYIALSNAYNTTPAYMQYLTGSNALSFVCAGGANTGYMTFSTGPGDERMRIDSSGNVGIGTSSPGQKLDVNGKIKATDVVGGSASSSLSLVAASSVNVDGASITLRGTSAGYDNGGIEFYTSSSGTGSERMRIDSSGNLLVGTTSMPSAAATTGRGAGISWDSILVINNVYSGAPLYINKTSSSGGTYFAGFQINGSNQGAIYSNGSGTAYLSSSDYRLKENIRPMQNALAIIQQLNPVTYTWKTDGSDGQGFIAHELQAVVPDCVSGEKDAVREVDVLDEDGKKIGVKEEPVYQGIDTSFLVATLTKAIQELKAEVDELRSKLTV